MINTQPHSSAKVRCWRAIMWAMLVLMLLPTGSASAESTITSQQQDTGIRSPNPLTTYVGFAWSSKFGGSIAATYCISANYHWLRSADVAPTAKFLGYWIYNSINGCETASAAIGTAIGETVEIGIGASTTEPRGSLAGTDYYYVTRTGPDAVSAVYHHSHNSAPPVVQTPPPSGQVCPLKESLELKRTLPVDYKGTTEELSLYYKAGLYEGTSFWPSVKVENTTSQPQQVNVTFDVSWNGGNKRVSRAASIGANSAGFVSLQPSDAIATDGLVDWSAQKGLGAVSIRVSADKCSEPARLYDVLVRPRPVILVHGYTGNAASWKPYEGWLEKSGIESLAVRLDLGDSANPKQQTSPIDVNGLALWGYIRKIQKDKGAVSVDIIAHSMGGLVSRYYIHALMPRNPRVVRQLIMLGTPNAGSYLATAVASLQNYMPASYELTPWYMVNIFNPRITDRYGVVFRAIAGVAPSQCLGVRIPFPIPNDCVVTVDSVRAIPLTQFYQVPGVNHDGLKNEAVFDSYVKLMLESKTSQIRSIARATAEPTTELTMLELAADQLPDVSAAHLHTTAADDVYSRSIKVDGQDAVTFNLLSNVSNAQVTLADPRGVVVDTFAITQTVHEDSLLPQYSYTVEQPESGTWTLTFDPVSSVNAVQADANPPQVAVLALGVQDPSRRILVPQDPEDKVVGTTTLVQARMGGSGILTDVTMYAEIQSPSGQKQQLLMDSPDDIYYQTRLDLQEEGIYTISIYVDGILDGQPFRRVDGTSITSKPATPPTCDLKSQGDANCDGSITLRDFEIFRQEYNNIRQTLDADFNEDGQVTLRDFEIFRQGLNRPQAAQSIQARTEDIAASEPITVSLESAQQYIEVTETITVDVFLDGSSNAQTSGTNFVVSYSQDAVEYQEDESSVPSTSCQAFNESQGFSLGAPVKIENDTAAGRLTIARVSQRSALPSGRFCVGTLVFKPSSEVISGTQAQVMLDEESRAWDIVGPQTEFIQEFDPDRSRVVIQIGEEVSEVYSTYLPLTMN